MGFKNESPLSSSSSPSSSMNDSLGNDASSSSTSSSNGPLYELAADLMAHLPIKRRGLSKFYNGKSQTFGSLSSVKSVKELGKEEMMMSYNARMKSCKTSTIIHHKFAAPKPTIAKKSSTTKASSCLASSSFATKTFFSIHS